MKTVLYALVLFSLLAGLLFSPFTASRVSAAVDCGDTYTVQRGDYLTKIAQYCGVSYSTLLKNNPEIKDPNKIYVGQVIRIKAGATIPGVPVTGTVEYTVVKGDTLFKIAVKFGTTTDYLLKLNPEIKDASKIYTGQKIRVPASPTTGTPGTPSSNANITVSTTSLKAGEQVEVKVKGFPTNAEIDFRMGVDGSDPVVIVDGKTNASGETSVKLTVPSSAKVGEKWSVRVLTTNLTSGNKEAKSPVITIK